MTLTTDKTLAGSVWTIRNLSKILALSVLFGLLLSFNYVGFAFSRSLLETPIQLIFVAFIDSLLLSYFVVSFRLTGWKAWAVVFLAFYGMNYVLTAVEAVYLTSLLTEDVVFGLLVNGAIVSAAFAALLVWVFGKGSGKGEAAKTWPTMPVKQWVWKVIASGLAYLLLYMVFGLVVYFPLARLLDPAALAQEQGSVAPSSAALIFPVEIIRGAIWALFALPAMIALRFRWRRNALVMGLLFAVPTSVGLFLSTAIVPGLQLAHFAELFGENLVFGMTVVWIFHSRSSLQTPSSGF